MKSIIITIQVPDGVNVSVGSSSSQTQGKPFVARDAPPEPSGVCPEHELDWKLVPAGFSRTKVDDQGNPKRYNAFWACPERGCIEKPPRDQAMTVIQNQDNLPF